MRKFEEEATKSENKQIAKELMLTVLSSDKTSPTALFSPSTAEGYRFEDIWNQILKTVSGKQPSAA
jgi:hypothetical protein